MNDSDAEGIDPTGDWVRALDAVHMLARTFGDRIAKETLLSRLADGSVALKASLVLQEADIGRLNMEEDYALWGEAPKRHPRQRDKSWITQSDGSEEFPLVVVESDFFALSGGWTIDSAQVSWAEGIILARRPAQFRRFTSKVRVLSLGREMVPTVPKVAEADAFIRRAVSGLRFRLSDIREMLPEHGPLPHRELVTRTPPASMNHALTERRGSEARADVGLQARNASPQSSTWNFGPVLSELHARIEEGTMNEFGPVSSLDAKRNLQKYISGRAVGPEGKAPSRNTVKTRVEAVMARWLEKERGLKPKH